MLDSPENLCHSQTITAPVPGFGTDAPCFAMPENGRKSSLGHGGRRPGAGRKPNPIIVPTFAADIPRWCVFMVWGQAEMSAASELTRHGYETYLPMVAIRRRDPVIATQFHIVRVPFLAGYGFIRLTQSESRDPILAVRGVRDVIRRPDGRSATVSDVEIERLQANDMDRLKIPAVAAPVLADSSTVRITEGPFQSFIGQVVQCDGVKTQVAVDLFGRMTPVWLDRTGVELA